mmetsp:Transcript_36913/g.98340  ORF Transcript_36913/g.98340 Transcript_36913/m.98340 type:complete len:212 (-) Transcript_36913:469-1104(-)
MTNNRIARLFMVDCPGLIHEVAPGRFSIGRPLDASKTLQQTSSRPLVSSLCNHVLRVDASITIAPSKKKESRSRPADVVRPLGTSPRCSVNSRRPPWPIERSCPSRSSNASLAIWEAVRGTSSTSISFHESSFNSNGASKKASQRPSSKPSSRMCGASLNLNLNFPARDTRARLRSKFTMSRHTPNSLAVFSKAPNRRPPWRACSTICTSA